MSQTAREINRIEEMGLYCTSNNYAFNNYAFNNYAFNNYTFNNYTFNNYTFNNYTFNKTPNSYQNNAGCLKGSLHK